MKIQRVHAREVLDSRGQPTVEVEVTLKNGVIGRATVPSGASTGAHEAVELRDGGKRFLGKGVARAVDPTSTKKSRRGCAAKRRAIKRPSIRSCSTSMARRTRVSSAPTPSWAFRWRWPTPKRGRKDLSLYRYLGGATAKTLPVPMLNVLNGGAHADNNVDVQEFMIVPYGMRNFAEALRGAAEIFQTLKKVLHDRGLSTSVGDEGGFAPRLKSNAEAIELLLEAITQAGYKAGRQVALGARRGVERILRRRRVCFQKIRRAQAQPRRHGPALRRLGAPVSDHLHRRWFCRR